MENKGKIRRRSFTLFRKSRPPQHFSPAKKPVITDPEGSYTGTPVNFMGEISADDLYPTQDADDL